MDAIENARVLDLYAGSGALGLEAWSRGAAQVDLVELSRPAATVIGRNTAVVAKAMGGPVAAKVHQSAVRAFLGRSTGTFDLVFTDPPYDLTDEGMNGDLVALAPLLSPDAVVVIERGKRATAPDLEAAGLELLREKTYGDTRVWWAQPAIGPADDTSAQDSTSL